MNNYKKYYFNNRPRTAIICETKYKWDTVTKEFGLTWTSEDKWTAYKENSAIVPETNMYCSIDYYKSLGNYELIDFDYVELDGTPYKSSYRTEEMIENTSIRTNPSKINVDQSSVKKQKGDIIGVKVIKNFPNQDGLTVGATITMSGSLKHKWKGVDYYKQFPEFFEWVYGYMPIFFGGQEVVIRKNGNINCEIYCNGKSDNYLHLLELKDAIDKLKNFHFGGQKFEFIYQTWNAGGAATHLKFGCTTGTYLELEAILRRCERILTE